MDELTQEEIEQLIKELLSKVVGTSYNTEKAFELKKKLDKMKENRGE